MMMLADPGADSRRDLGGTRVSDEDLLYAIRRNLAAVYTEVLEAPIPDGIAAVLTRLDNFGYDAGQALSTALYR